MVNIQCHSFIQVIGLHSFIPLWRSFTHFFLVPLLGLAITWLSFTQGIGLFISHHSHTLIIRQLVYISFIHSLGFVHLFVYVLVCPFIHSSLASNFIR